VTTQAADGCLCSCGWCIEHMQHERCPYACGRAVCWLGQTLTDREEAAAIERHERLRARPALTRALHLGYLAPDTARAILDLASEPTISPSAGGLAAPEMLDLRPIGRILRIRWSGRG
jgi:hypothetical protein